MILQFKSTSIDIVLDQYFSPSIAGRLRKFTSGEISQSDQYMNLKIYNLNQIRKSSSFFY